MTSYHSTICLPWSQSSCDILASFQPWWELSPVVFSAGWSWSVPRCRSSRVSGRPAQSPSWLADAPQNDIQLLESCVRTQPVAAGWTNNTENSVFPQPTSCCHLTIDKAPRTESSDTGRSCLSGPSAPWSAFGHFRNWRGRSARPEFLISACHVNSCRLSATSQVPCSRILIMDGDDTTILASLIYNWYTVCHPCIGYLGKTHSDATKGLRLGCPSFENPSRGQSSSWGAWPGSSTSKIEMSNLNPAPKKNKKWAAFP